MTYLAVGLALSGTAIGFAFRWQALLPVILLVPIIVMIFSMSRGAGYEATAVRILMAEAALQGGYFLGLLLRLLVSWAMAIGGRRDSQGAAKTPDNDHHPAPPTEA
ncbi:hypothetical protein [Bradyrhizobium sp. HKCCYLS20291]|uniref:hypothetical protein n=1 Tax=Bradyrhizobium sp. HKCCYLS20291 TaxID=3420766 RepID=UPI003EB81F51